MVSSPPLLSCESSVSVKENPDRKRKWRHTLWKNFPAAIRIWSKINYGDESTSSQTFNYFLCMFSDMTVTDLVEKFKMPVWKRLGRGTHSQNRNEPNSRTFSKLFPHYKFQIQRFNCKISPGLAQLVNRAASTTGYDSTNKALFFQML